MGSGVDMTPEERQQLSHGLHQAHVALDAGRLADARRGLLKAVRAIEKAEARNSVKVNAHALN
jgi:hypothetical protein